MKVNLKDKSNIIVSCFHSVCSFRILDFPTINNYLIVNLCGSLMKGWKSTHALGLTRE